MWKNVKNFLLDTFMYEHYDHSEKCSKNKYGIYSIILSIVFFISIVGFCAGIKFANNEYWLYSALGVILLFICGIMMIVAFVRTIMFAILQSRYSSGKINIVMVMFMVINFAGGISMGIVIL